MLRARIRVDGKLSVRWTPLVGQVLVLQPQIFAEEFQAAFAMTALRFGLVELAPLGPARVGNRPYFRVHLLPAAASQQGRGPAQEEETSWDRESPQESSLQGHKTETADRT